MTARHPPSDAAFAHYAAAAEAVERGRVGELEALYGECLQELEAADASRGAPANHNLSVALQQREDLDGALFHCVRALFLYHRSADLPGTWAGLQNLAVLFQARGENRRAMDTRRQAAEVRAQIVELGRYVDQEEGRDGAGEPLLLLSVRAGRRDRSALG
jgi:tetratricopeptide (TPR) repeat protein